MALSLNLNGLADKVLPPSMAGELGAYSGKLQQTVNGVLVKHTY